MIRPAAVLPPLVPAAESLCHVDAPVAWPEPDPQVPATATRTSSRRSGAGHPVVRQVTDRCPGMAGSVVRRMRAPLRRRPTSQTSTAYGQPTPGAGASTVSTWPVRGPSAMRSALRQTVATRNGVLLSTPPSMHAKHPRSRSIVSRASPPSRTRMQRLWGTSACQTAFSWLPLCPAASVSPTLPARPWYPGGCRGCPDLPAFFFSGAAPYPGVLAG